MNIIEARTLKEKESEVETLLNISTFLVQYFESNRLFISQKV
jgi:hypothetical protein